MMKDPLSPLRGNAFIKAKIDAENAGKTSFSFNGRNYPLKMEEESPLNEINPRLVSSIADELESRASDQLMASNFGVSDRPDFRNSKEMSTTPSFDEGYDPGLSRQVGIDVVQGGIKSNVTQQEFSKYGNRKNKKSNRKRQKPTTFGYSDGPKDYNLSLHNKSKVRHFGSGAPAPEFLNLPTSDRVAVKK